jgi:hypothetical protein
MTAVVTTGSALDRLLPHFDAETTQRAIVQAAPATTYDAIWAADLLGTPLARGLSALAMCPERLRAWLRHEPPPPPTARSARLGDLLTSESPWRLLADEPGSEVVLGLLWTPPAGVATCTPEAFADFDHPGVAKVAWAIAVLPFGAGHTLLMMRTRTHAVDAVARRRFALLWPLIAPFAALLRGQALRAIKASAETR